MRVHRLGADKLPSTGGPALRVELHHPSLHRHPSRPGARPAPVPAPRAPILEAQRCYSAPAPRIETAAALSGSRWTVGVAARPTDGLVNLVKEARRASTHPTGPARTCPRTTTIADLTGANAEVVFIACHKTTIGSQNGAATEKCARRRIAWKHLHRRARCGLFFPAHCGRWRLDR